MMRDQLRKEDFVMPPANRTKTAFLVIHGVGPHKPFEVCDSFVRGFFDVFKEKHQGSQVHHQLRKREDWLGKGIPWVQNYLRLSIPNNGGYIDFYEYFWDIYMVHEVCLSEALQLLIKASKGAKRFYERVREEYPDLLVKAMDVGEYGRKRRFGRGSVEFRPAGYLKLLRPSSRLFTPFFVAFLNVLPYLPFIIKVVDWWTRTQIPILSHVLRACVVFIDKFAQDFVGDLVGYLDLDPRSEHYEIRRKILNGALDELRELMKAKDDDGNDEYEQIIVAGHSLGSVIAYDTLNRIIQETNAGRTQEDDTKKIVGLITFGSPLDKIACFFRERVEKDKEVQRQILANLHGFRTLSLVEDTPGIDIGTPMQFKLDKTRWLNFYHTRDLISGNLDLYNLKEQPFQHPESKGNTLIDADVPMTAAHNCYWGAHQGKNGTNQMYQGIIKEFFQ